MNLAHVHLLLNHFPTIGMIVGLGVFFVALIAKSDDLKRASLLVFFALSLVSIPTFVTGTAAELTLQNTPDVSKSVIETHETAAFIALSFMELLGALGWLGLWQYRRLSRFPQGTIAATMLVGLVTLGLMTRAANLGGQIRHPEIGTGPSVVKAADGAQETTEPNPPLARVIGDAMVNLKWGWPAAETVHFIGLSLLFGVVLLVDLRMLGFMKSIPYPALHRLLPWGVLGFGVNVLTGMLFFIGAPTDFYVTNGVFLWKLALILIAGANALYFTMFDETWVLEAGDSAPMTAKIAAASGILLWVGVIFCGQMLPFLGHSF